jgi:hypothetical protein
MMLIMSDLERRTTVTVYAADLAWMKTRQRKISSDRNKWITMADLVHELILASEKPQDGA